MVSAIYRASSVGWITWLTWGSMPSGFHPSILLLMRISVMTWQTTKTLIPGTAPWTISSNSSARRINAAFALSWTWYSTTPQRSTPGSLSPVPRWRIPSAIGISGAAARTEGESHPIAGNRCSAEKPGNMMNEPGNTTTTCSPRSNLTSTGAILRYMPK